MRASLASATSLLALLLVEGHEARATPSVTTTTSQPVGFGIELVGGSATSHTEHFTISGQTSGDTLSISGASGFTGVGGTGQSEVISGTGTTTLAVTYSFSPPSVGVYNTTVVGLDATRSGTAASLTLTGTGVAPIATVSSSNAPISGFYLVNSQTATTTLTISNSGDGYLADSNKSSASATYNLKGSVSAGNSVFTATAATISLEDSHYSGSNPKTSQTAVYTFTPTVTGVATATVNTTFTNGGATNNANTITTTLSGTGVAPVQSVANSVVYGRIGSGTAATGAITVANIGDGNMAGSGTNTKFQLNGSIAAFSSGGFAGSAQSVSLASNATISTPSTATSTLGYTYTPGSSHAATSTTVSINFSDGNSNGTNALQTVAPTLTGSAVGPTYASTLVGKGVDTPAVNGNGTTPGAAGATISFGTVSYKVASTLLLDLGNVTTDGNGGNANLTNLTIDAYSITGANAAAFSVSSISSVITEGGMLVVPITVTSNIPYSSLSSSLTIFTDEGTGLGGYGENFTYALTALSVPEPTSLAVLGAGLVGLAGFRSRKRAAQKG